MSLVGKDTLRILEVLLAICEVFPGVMKVDFFRFCLNFSSDYSWYSFLFTGIYVIEWSIYSILVYALYYIRMRKRKSKDW